MPPSSTFGGVKAAEKTHRKCGVKLNRGAAFAIPGAFGAQEAGLILLCGLFEIPPDQALALSLIKRAADLVVGVPGLVSLQVLEGGRLKALYSHAREGRARNRP